VSSVRGEQMSASRKGSDPDWVDDDDVPDLTGPEWVEAFAKADVRRGLPPLAGRKVSTTIELDADVLAKFRATGPGWQSRINAILKAAKP
jgi:uncharacterized protein (DUF4415 family)